MHKARKPYSVSELNFLSKKLLEQTFLQVNVIGEISGLKKYGSGHWYFTLKDQNSEVSCAMFKGDNFNVGFNVVDGMQVLITGKVTIYSQRGQYQLIANTMHNAGEGLLRQQLEQLKRKLEQQGLFAAEHKKPVPKWANNIGLITSKSGAALQDMLKVFAETAPWLTIHIFDSLVQGDTAAENLITALSNADNKNLDVLIIGRGGGSLEDLWAFNDEQLAQAIFNCNTPIISAVGHEIDHSISDYVADNYVATPTSAAKLVCENWQNLPGMLRHYRSSLNNIIKNILQRQQLQLANYKNKLAANSPQNKLAENNYTLDQLRTKLKNIANIGIQNKTNQLNSLANNLRLLSPVKQLQENKFKLNKLKNNLNSAIAKDITNKQHLLKNLTTKIAVLGPDQTLQRGYSITTINAKVIENKTKVKKGDTITTILKDGKIISTATDID